jgi:hypothetical protein
MAEIVLSLTVGEFRRVALERVEWLVRSLSEREAVIAGAAFVKQTPTALIRHRTDRDILQSIDDRMRQLVESHPRFDACGRALGALLDRVTRAVSAPELLEAFESLLEVEDAEFPGRLPADRDLFSMRADASRVYLQARVEPMHDEIAAAVDSDIADLRYVTAVMRLLHEIRESRRLPNRDETAAIQAAFRLLDRGVQIPTAYQSLGTSGFRHIQTYLSVADPGDGHIKVTCADPLLLRGTAVHVEQIDRDLVCDRDLVEPYRLPAALTAARVRLHVGMAAPCTAFIGRPVFESGDVRRDLLKAVHLSASSCTAMFINGFADCKIAIERMTATEAVEFMQCLAGNVIRDSSRQSLTAAFNVHTPIRDDRDGRGGYVATPYAIARLGIELARAGGFDRIAWDGSWNDVPSHPIVEQFTHADLLDLVHRAHEQGLQVYVSAGLEPRHIGPCVRLGVDGIGIGRSLHYVDHDSQLMGPLKPDAIADALALRDAAQRETLGRAAKLLARLDRLWFERALRRDEDEVRIRLFEALTRGDDAEAERAAARLAHIDDMPPNSDDPILEAGRRLVASLLGQTDADAGQFGAVPSTVIDEVRRLVDCRDVMQLRELLRGQW